MNRRNFLWTTIGAAAGSRLFTRPVGAQQPGNPKVYLFGMIVIDDSNGLAAVFPQIDGMVQHRAFLAASAAAIKALKGTPVDITKSGLHRVHQDFSYSRWPSAWCLSDHPFTIGSGATSVQQSLKDRLPSLSKLGSEPTISRHLTTKLPPGSFTVRLGGGTLRLPAQKSTSLGTEPNVLWQFRNGATAMGSPMNRTDMAVFESATPKVDISGNGGTLSMGPGDVVWFFNLPLIPGVDTDATTIEHAAEPFTLLTPALTSNQVTAKTTSNLKFPGYKEPLIHPCARTPADQDRAKRYVTAKNHGIVTIFYAPPDSDPCFISAV